MIRKITNFRTSKVIFLKPLYKQDLGMDLFTFCNFNIIFICELPFRAM